MKYKIIPLDTCFQCGVNTNIHQHHVVPRTLGGTETIPLCVNCHGLVHDRSFLTIGNLIKHGKMKTKNKPKKIKVKYDPLIITRNKITLNVDTDEKMEISNKINGLLKKNESISKILDTKEKLKNTNQKVIQKNVADISGLSLGTVKRYYRYKSIVDLNEVLTQYGLSDIPITSHTKTIIPRKEKALYRSNNTQSIGSLNYGFIR